MQKCNGWVVFGIGMSLLAGCGSGGSSGGEGTVSDAEIDTSETVVVPAAEQIVETPELLVPGVTLTGSVAPGESQIFRVPSGAEVSVLSSSGNADLFLLDDMVVADDTTVLCGSAWPVIEDNCSATLEDGEIFAFVFGRTEAEFSINVTNDCSVPSVNEWVYRNMQDYYPFADNVPVVNPADFENSRDLLNELRFNERDVFSSLTDAVAQQDFFESGADVGFGANFFGSRVSLVYSDSPFGRANIKRGDIILSIDDVLTADIGDGVFFELVGDRDNPNTNVWRIMDGVTGEIRDVSLTQSEFTINSVVHESVYTNDSGAVVGYLVFTDFIETSEAELDAALTRFAQRGITELILDLRYNGGGRVSVANKLASQIGGVGLDGQVLSRIEFNSKYPERNTEDLFEAAIPSLDIDRLVVITSDGTASASELIINSLRPYMEVVLVGEATRGKSFISRAKTYCGLALNAMDSQSINANGVNVSDGIAADCFAADDVTRPFGGTGADTEGTLAAALDYSFNGVCNAAPTLAKQRSIASAEILNLLNNERSFAGADSGASFNR